MASRKNKLLDLPSDHLLLIARYFLPQKKFYDSQLKAILNVAALNNKEAEFLLNIVVNDAWSKESGIYAKFYSAVLLSKSSSQKIIKLNKLRDFPPAKAIINILTCNFESLEENNDPTALYYVGYHKKDMSLIEKAANAGHLDALWFCGTNKMFKKWSYYYGKYVAYTLGQYERESLEFYNSQIMYIAGREMDDTFNLWPNKQSKHVHIHAVYKTVTENARRAALFIIHSKEFCHVKDIRRMIAKIVYFSRYRHVEEWLESNKFN